MKKTLLILAISIFALTACEEGTNTPDLYDWDKSYKIFENNWNMTNISMVDIDDDGDDDIIGVNSLSNKKYGIVGLYMNNSNNNTIKFEYQNQFFRYFFPIPYNYNEDLSVLDMNTSTSKGKDIFINKQFYEKNGNEWELQQSWSNGLESISKTGILFGDLNDDDLLDILDIQNGVLYRQCGSESKPSWAKISSASKLLKDYKDGVLYDYDRDGDLDIFALGYHQDYKDQVNELVIACYSNIGSSQAYYFEPDYDLTQKLNQLVNKEMKGIHFADISITAGYINASYPSNIIIQAGENLGSH